MSASITTESFSNRDKLDLLYGNSRRVPELRSLKSLRCQLPLSHPFLIDRRGLGGVSPLSTSPAVGPVGGGGSAPAGLFASRSRTPGSGRPAHLLGAARPEADCPADP